MADSAKTVALAADRDQFGVIGKLRSRRITLTFGSDYAAAVLPRVTAAELGLAEVVTAVPEGVASTGASANPAVTAGGADFTVKLWDGTTAIGTTDQHTTTVNLLVLGH